MRLDEFHTQLKSLGLPVAYSHFKKKQRLPYITYIETAPTVRRADDVTHSKILHIDVEFYSENKDTAGENKIEELLNTLEIPYEISDSIHIESEDCFQRVFSISLI